MKFDFTYYNPTRIHFGKDSLSHLSDELSAYGKNVLLMYGKGSVKKSGLYDKVTAILKDCAKGISVSAYCEGDPWQKYWVDSEPVNNKIVPVASILTMAGTGSEMNGGSVITNEEQKLKNGRVFPAEIYPKFSILNPEYTFTVPIYQMASGIFDTMSHLMEQYFSGTDDNTSDYILEGLMRSLIHSANIAMENPQDYEARSNIMWCATVGLNTISGLSKEQDWEVHMIEHQLGAYTDCAHGAGLAAISGPYYRYILPYGTEKFARFAKRYRYGKDERRGGGESVACGFGRLH